MAARLSGSSEEGETLGPAEEAWLVEEVAACTLPMQPNNGSVQGLNSGNGGFTFIPVLVQLPPWLVIIG